MVPEFIKRMFPDVDFDDEDQDADFTPECEEDVNSALGGIAQPKVVRLCDAYHARRKHIGAR